MNVSSVSSASYQSSNAPVAAQKPPASSASSAAAAPVSAPTDSDGDHDGDKGAKGGKLDVRA